MDSLKSKNHGHSNYDPEWIDGSMDSWIDK
jgi:hypothetical protein